MAFKATKISKGTWLVHGLESFIENKVREALTMTGTAAKSTTNTKTTKAVTQAAKVKKFTKPTTNTAATSGGDVVDQLVRAAQNHPKKNELLKAGKQKDQLLRSLVPLYLARSMPNAEISSGVTSKFWDHFGVKYAAPNAAKALREHVGFARRSKNGVAITPNGVKYIEEAFKAKVA